MDQRVRFRAAHRCAARPAHPSRPYPAIEWRQLQAQSEQAPITPFQFRYAGGSSQPSLILVETAPRWGLLPGSLMYFCFGRPMHHCSGVDIRSFAGPRRMALGRLRDRLCHDALLLPPETLTAHIKIGSEKEGEEGPAQNTARDS